MKGFDVDVTDLTCEINLKQQQQEEINRHKLAFIRGGGHRTKHGPTEYKHDESKGFTAHRTETR